MINQQKVEEAVKMLLEALGEDPSREGLMDTPERMARMYQEILGGVEDDASKHLHKTFLAGNNDMVVEKDITFYSTCEHHMMPFFGKAHIAYVPDGKVVGLSKLARCVEAFARRLQIQEKMTQQIAEAMMVHLAPKGVMVVIEAEHLCMTMRGVSKPGSKTLTVITKGCFAEREDLRNTFWSMVR